MKKSEAIDSLIKLKDRAALEVVNNPEHRDYFEGKVVAFNIAIEFIKGITEVDE